MVDITIANQNILLIIQEALCTKQKHGFQRQKTENIFRVKSIKKLLA